MKKTTKARKVSSPEIKGMLDLVSDTDMEKARIKMGIAASIADALHERGIAKSALAARLNKRPSEVTKWLSGTHNFTVETLVEIAEALSMKLDAFFDAVHVPERSSIEITVKATQHYRQSPYASLTASMCISSGMFTTIQGGTASKSFFRNRFIA